MLFIVGSVCHVCVQEPFIKLCSSLYTLVCYIIPNASIIWNTVINIDKCLWIDKVMNCQSCLMTFIEHIEYDTSSGTSLSNTQMCGGLGKPFTWRFFFGHFLLYIVLETSDFINLNAPLFHIFQPHVKCKSSSSCSVDELRMIVQSVCDFRLNCLDFELFVRNHS